MSQSPTGQYLYTLCTPSGCKFHALQWLSAHKFERFIENMTNPVVKLIIYLLQLSSSLKGH